MNEQESKNNFPTTVEGAMREASRHGLHLSDADLDEMYHQMDTHRTQLEASKEAPRQGWQGWLQTFNLWYPKVLAALLAIGDVMITLTHTLLIAFGVPLILLVLLVVEQQRVQHGVSLFEINLGLAAASAAALVMLNLILELLIHWIEHQERWIEPPKHQFSLRITYQRWLYIVGQTSDWQPESKSPAQRFRGVLRVVTLSILVLALAGSMESVIMQAQGNWLQAIQHIFTQSSLLEIFTWIGGFFLAYAVVRSAQALSQYVAKKVVQVVAIMTSTAEDKPRLVAEAVGMFGASIIYAKLHEFRQARRALRAATSAQAFSPLQGNAQGSINLSPDLKPAGKGVEGASNCVLWETLTDDQLRSIEHLPQALRNGVKYYLKNATSLEGLNALSVRTVSLRADVSDGTASAARKWVREMLSANGHGDAGAGEDVTR